MSEQRAITVKRQSLDLMSLGNALASSGYFSDARDQAQAIVKVLAGQELGIGPIASMTGIHIIQGKPTYSANVMAAVIKRHPEYDYEILELDDKQCTLQFIRNGKADGPASQFTMKDAAQAGLLDGKNGHSWKKYPRNMLFARALSNLARWFCPDAFSGVPPYTPEELGANIDDDGEVIEGQAEIKKPEPAANLAEAIPNDDTSAWYPNRREFKEKCEEDFSQFGADWDMIREILKTACGFEDYDSGNASAMYNCLCDHFAKQRSPEAGKLFDDSETEAKPVDALTS